jgi:hypothetical protein
MAAKSKMTLDKLARIAQDEFLIADKKIDGVYKEMRGGFLEIRNEMATKDDLRVLRNDMVKNFATKDDLHMLRSDIVGEVRKENHKIIVSNDRVVDKLDILLKEEVARTEQYKRQAREIDLIKERVGV